MGQILWQEFLGRFGPLLCKAAVVQERGEDGLDCLLWVGDHQQDGLIELVGEDHLKGDCQVEGEQLEGIPVFFCELQP